MLKQRVPPEINAISALMILASILLVGGSLLLQQRGAKTEA
jgi:ABC-type spermidine/putrescine transport system permease subunit II